MPWKSIFTSRTVVLSDKSKEIFLRIIDPIGGILARFNVHPNSLTLAGLILSMAAGLVYSTGSFFWGAWVVVLAGSCDVLDGWLARKTGKHSPFGAFFDSTLDRFGELFIFLGLAWHFSGGPGLFQSPMERPGQAQSLWAIVCIILAIAGSFMVSYTRARAEGLGVTCNIGWMQRPERMTLLIIGSLLASIPGIGHVLMKLTLLMLAVLSNVTAVQRMFFVKRKLLRENRVQ